MFMTWVPMADLWADRPEVTKCQCSSHLQQSCVMHTSVLVARSWPDGVLVLFSVCLAAVLSSSKRVANMPAAERLMLPMCMAAALVSVLIVCDLQSLQQCTGLTCRYVISSAHARYCKHKENAGSIDPCRKDYPMYKPIRMTGR